MYNGYETEELVQDHIKALLRELEQCESIGAGDRAEMVRAQLRTFGHKVSKPQAVAETREGEPVKRRPGRPRKTETRKG